MLIKLALAAVLVLGAASTAALAGDNSGEYSGGFVIPGNTVGVNPVYHPELAPTANGRKAYDLAPAIKLTPRTWQKGREAYDSAPSVKQERDRGEDYGPEANK